MATLNKKQRRKLARANLQHTKLLDYEHDTIDQTQTTLSAIGDQGVKDGPLVNEAKQNPLLASYSEVENV